MRFRMMKPLYAIIALLFYSFMFMGAISMLFFKDLLIIGIITVTIFLFVSYYMVDSFLIRSIVICEEGVKYISLQKKFFMKWSEIKIVGLGYVPIKAPGKQPWIYFAADGISMPMLDARLVNSQFFMVSYRKELEEAIRVYWKENIDGLDSMSEFEKRNTTISATSR